MAYKKLLLLLLLCGTLASAFAQGEKRVKFTTCFKPSSTKGEGELIIKGAIQKGYHIFAFDPGGDGSQVPTEVKLAPAKGVQYIGKPKEGTPAKKEEIKELDITINCFYDNVTYIQKVRYSSLAKGTGGIYFQVCNDNMCERPTEVPIAYDLSQNCDGTVAVAAGNKDTIAAPKSDTVPSVAVAIPAGIDSASIASQTQDSNSSEAAGAPDAQGNFGKYGKPVSDCGTVQKESLSPWLAFLYGILGGFAALFFPCTLPMIPMTISFFLKNKGGKKAGVRNGVFYGFSIFLVYFLLSLPFLFLGWGGNVLNDFSTSPTVNLVFFAIFMVFAFSLFGFYDISLPSGLASKIDSKSNNSTFIGIFFMAFTLAIVSFSCTGPILGLVLGNIKDGALITPAMSGFGIGLGVPFALFAMFPNLLKALPKSGGWLTTLKVVFGFIEVAFALKFLSNADLVKQWGLLKREVFIGLWIVVLVLLGLYLLGIFRIKKTEVYKRTTAATILAVLSFLFAGYLATDYIGKDISLVSGFPPPKFYSYGYKETKHKNGEMAKSHMVNGLTTYLTLEEAIAEGKRQGKPVMIDFTGWACVNCRKMEENVWVKPGVYTLLKDKYIIASLYVDEKTALPQDQQFESPFLKGTARTVGDKWFDLSLRHFKSAGQPYYALIDPVNERILNTPVPYTPDASTYKAFLECGLTNYATLNPAVPVQ